MRLRDRMLAAVLLAVGLAACRPTAPGPLSETLIAPRQLATVIISPTPVRTLVVPPTPTPVPSATRTPVPPTLTPSPTPYVGVFLGDGSVPLILPTASLAALVEITLLPPTPLGGALPPTYAIPTMPGMAVAAGGPCSAEVAAPFAAAIAARPEVGAALGCPLGPPETIFMAHQPFEQGVMFWWSTGEIYALSLQPVSGVANPFWRVADQWQEGMPQDDPSMTVPAGLLQPIRGFGLAWRTNAQIRTALGWAVSNESGYTGMFQRFSGGAIFTAPENAVYILIGDGAPGSASRYFGPLY
ncbi:MAG: hypothetical protein HPY64_14640 [Anaerolineae bacterium]|nr:hypothetical protein [Anaerolineae bacterium]